MTANNVPTPATAVEQLEATARMVQDVAYALAGRVDSTTMTELMLASRKLERLSKRIQASNLGGVTVGAEDDM